MSIHNIYFPGEIKKKKNIWPGKHVQWIHNIRFPGEIKKISKTFFVDK